MPKKAAPTKSTTTPAKGGVKKIKSRAELKSERKEWNKNPLFEKKPHNFGVGQHIQPKRDLTRFVRWPKYIRLQRQKRILSSRLKVPPTINQFTRTLDKSSATQLFKLLLKYRPESKIQKKARLLKSAEAKSKGETVPATTPKSNVVHFGINEVTRLVEQKKAKLVIIAHDVDPLELVVWLPTLCRKMNVPYVIVKGKARLGAAVYQTTSAAVALTSVDKEDLKDFTSLQELASSSFNNNTELRRIWGGGLLGNKAIAAQRKRDKALAKERAAKVQN